MIKKVQIIITCSLLLIFSFNLFALEINDELTLERKEWLSKEWRKGRVHSGLLFLGAGSFCAGLADISDNTEFFNFIGFHCTILGITDFLEALYKKNILGIVKYDSEEISTLHIPYASRTEQEKMVYGITEIGIGVISIIFNLILKSQNPSHNSAYLLFSSCIFTIDGIIYLLDLKTKDLPATPDK